MEKIYWRQQNGSKILVDDMGHQHLINTLKLILRHNSGLKLYGRKDDNDRFSHKDDMMGCEEDIY